MTFQAARQIVEPLVFIPQKYPKIPLSNYLETPNIYPKKSLRNFSETPYLYISYFCGDTVPIPHKNISYFCGDPVSLNTTVYIMSFQAKSKDPLMQREVPLSRGCFDKLNMTTIIILSSWAKSRNPLALVVIPSEVEESPCIPPQNHIVILRGPRVAQTNLIDKKPRYFDNKQRRNAPPTA